METLDTRKVELTTRVPNGNLPQKDNLTYLLKYIDGKLFIFVFVFRSFVCSFFLSLFDFWLLLIFINLHLASN